MTLNDQPLLAVGEITVQIADTFSKTVAINSILHCVNLQSK